MNLEINSIIIDASTAHRTNPKWSYGLPELGENYRKSIENSKRIASPGCYSTLGQCYSKTSDFK